MDRLERVQQVGGNACSDVAVDVIGTQLALSVDSLSLESLALFV
ncbi:hypothetical protein [Rosistilla oblonga]|nr:hypothetical protein [Rosistilla oblonga]